MSHYADFFFQFVLIGILIDRSSHQKGLEHVRYFTEERTDEARVMGIRRLLKKVLLDQIGIGLAIIERSVEIQF